MKYGKHDIDALLRAIDGELKQFASMIIIGGCAVILAYQGDFYTHDIDTFTPITDIQHAYEIARQKTRLHIPLQHSSVADAPYCFEERLQPYSLSSFKKLQVYIPEKHDLVLMKIMRADDHDIQHIYKALPLKQDLIIGRY